MKKKRFRFVFREKDGYFRRVVHSVCTEEEVQGCKEAWAVIIEEETGHAVVCSEVEDQGEAGS